MLYWSRRQGPGRHYVCYAQPSPGDTASRPCTYLLSFFFICLLELRRGRKTERLRGDQTGRQRGQHISGHRNKMFVLSFFVIGGTYDGTKDRETVRRTDRKTNGGSRLGTQESYRHRETGAQSPRGTTGNHTGANPRA